jgi:sulfhydrogenase subunit alpha
MSRPDVLRVAVMARVEGEGGVHVEVRDGRVTKVEMHIFEPPRFFEAFLRGRAAAEMPDLTARVCGICPVAYQFSACLAVERACGVQVPASIRQLRRLLYCGEWISSHALHVYLLHAPDFLGCEGLADLAATRPDVVERGLRLKQAGNRLMEVVGGRSIHPVNVRVGGFHRLPSRASLRELRPALEEALRDAADTVRLVSGFDVPDLEQPHEYLALDGVDRYPLEGGDLVITTGGGRFGVAEYTTRVVEAQVPWSTALHARLDAAPFVVGPLARYALNGSLLSPTAAALADEVGLGPVCRNPFRSIVVRSVEIVHAVEEALRIIEEWDGEGPAAVDVPVPSVPSGGCVTGHGATEAPRGLLYHRYRIAADGTVADARIVPPTAQNLTSLEDDLRAAVEAAVAQDPDRPVEELTRLCERVVRNYDPCISCATH